jgi:hypothetical protein
VTSSTGEGGNSLLDLKPVEVWKTLEISSTEVTSKGLFCFSRYTVKKPYTDFFQFSRKNSRNYHLRLV